MLKFSCEVFLLTGCTEVEEDLEDDQLSCTQESNENYFADTEDCSSVSSETDSALSDSESWDESLSGELFVFNHVIKFQLIYFPWAYNNNELVTMYKMSYNLNYK